MQLENKTASIMQPTFIPWIGYFNMISKSDFFVFLDDVQMAKRSWQTRNRIKSNGEPLFLSLKVSKANGSRNNINESYLIEDRSFIDKFLRTLELNYKKAKFYEKNKDFVNDILTNKQQTLARYNSHIIQNIAERLEIETKFLFSSELQSVGSKDEYLSNICQEIGCNKYLSALGSKDYIEEGHNYFSDKNIQVEYNHYEHPTYNQVGKTFLPYMSIIDAIFNIDFEQTREIIK